MNARMTALQKRFKDWKIDALLIEKPIDIFYLTNLKLSRGRLWVRPNDVELLVDGRYFGVAKDNPHCKVTLWVKGKENEQKGRIGFDSVSTSVDGLEKLKIESPHANWIPIVQPLQELRLIKDLAEIKCLKEAARITWAGIQHVRSLFVEGVTEQELAMEFEFFVRKSGASSVAFESIVAFGENSAHPHHRASNTKLKLDDVVLIDVGAVVEKYCADVTRVFFFGRADQRLQEMEATVRQASIAAIREAHIGATIGSLDRAARKVFVQKGVEDFFCHNLGHGLGLEPHECPMIRWDGEDQNRMIQEQMVLAIEPGLYRPGIGGVRYENSGVVTKKGFESFYPE